MAIIYSVGIVIFMFNDFIDCLSKKAMSALGNTSLKIFLTRIHLTLRVCPALRVDDAFIPLSLHKADTDVPLRAAILPRVSPLRILIFCLPFDADERLAD